MKCPNCEADYEIEKVTYDAVVYEELTTLGDFLEQTFKPPYVIWCKQRGKYFGEDTWRSAAVYDSLSEIRQQLTDYHMIDNEVEEIEDMSLYQIVNLNEWEIYTVTGEVVM